jgi:hypothetical protein
VHVLLLLLLLLLLQDLATASTQPVLLQSLASSADDLAPAETAAEQLAAAAASTAAELAAAYQPMADALLQCLLYQRSDNPHQQQQQVLQLPVEVLEAAICRAAAAAVAVPITDEEDVEQLSRPSSADSLSGAPCSTRGGDSSTRIQRAVAVLQQQLEVLGWPFVSSHSDANQRHRRSSSSTAREQQPHSYQLASLLPLVPVSVAVAVAGTNVAAALAAIHEAAAAAGVPASSIQLCSASSSNTAYAAATTSETADKCKWLVLLLEEASVEAVAAAAQWLAAARHAATVLLAQQRTNTSSSTSTSNSSISTHHHHSSSNSSRGSTPRIWVALPMKLAAALSAASGHTCLLWRLQNCSSSSSSSLTGSSLLHANATRHPAAAHVMGAMLQLQARGLLQCDKPVVQNLLQPLLVAALAAQQQLSRQQRSISLSSGLDLCGPADSLHLQLVLQQVAAAAAAAAAAGLQAAGPMQQDPSVHCSSSSSSSSSSGVRGNHAAEFCKPLKHLARLPLDLQQLQQLLQWAVFGPSSSSSTSWQLSQQALQENFTAAKLGVRERRGAAGACGFSEVQVLGGCIADAVEDAARQQRVVRKMQQQQMHLLGVHNSADGGVLGDFTTAADDEHVAGMCAKHGERGSRSDCLLSSGDASEEEAMAAAAADDDDDYAADDGGGMDGSTASGCLLPLGLSLSSEALWALLLQMITG